jgi:RimJ/RimL family protein N-acetyltransferase
MTSLDLAARNSSRNAGPAAAMTTARLIMRSPRPADAKALAHLLNDRRIAENTARIPHPYRVADAQAFLVQANRNPAEPTFLIELADGTLIGGCGIATASNGDPELGYWIGVAHWGRGYATEAARALIDHAFGELGAERMSSRARVSNPASRRVLEKCGFQWSGVALIRIRALKSSAPVDCFRLDRGLWASLRSWGNADPFERGTRP